ncbi:DUF3710 domain-containing protein [Brevibacterium samyangense]|uniref:DUF3710 domain-containing protein n=1 Tax=Brevibacterium samyangense TaxID=366888 RepID=A0ABN2TDL0_9MICO
MGLFDFLRKKDDRAADRPDADDRFLEDAEATEEDTRPVTAETGDAEDDEEWVSFDKSAPRDRAENGPWDADEDYPEANRIDLGALRVPVRDGMQVRLDVQDRTRRIMAVTLVHGGGSVQLQAFAAPASEGLWNDVRRQITEKVTTAGGKVDELYTDLGHEIVTKSPAKLPDGRVGMRLTRFAGIDGPRWFLRAVFNGKALAEESVLQDLQEIVRGTVVVRGSAAMPPRELLALTEPKAAGAQDAAGDTAAGTEPKKDDLDDLDPFERGPEITEVR